MIKPLMNNRQRSHVVFIVCGFSPSSSSDPFQHRLFLNNPTLSFYPRVFCQPRSIYLRSDRPQTTGWEMLLLSFSLFVTVTFIHPLMRPRVPPTFDEHNGLHILDIRSFLLNLHAIAPIQASEYFHCFPSAPASYSKYYDPRQTRRLRQLMPSMPSIFPFFSLAVILSTFYLSAFTFSPAQPNV